MKRVTGVRLLLVVSLVLNVGLVSQFLVDIRKTRLTPALAAATYRRGKDGGEHFVLDFTTPMAPELVASTPDPVHVIPAFVYDLVWESPRRCALIPAKPLTPGIGVSIRPNPDLRDAAGTRLSTAAIALNTPPVVCLEIGATHRLTANQTRLDFRFNGAVRPVDLKAATKATDKAGHALDITAPETEPLTSPSITVTHPSDCEVFTLTVGPGLRATGAEVGMAKPFTRKVGLSDGLLLGEVTAGSNNDGIYLRCSIPGPIAVEQLGRFISVSPDVGEVHFEPEYWGGRYRLRGAFKPRSYYKVTFRDGLHTTDGRRLRKEVTRSVVTGNRQSVLSFATRGPFFPSHRRPVLPIETCNVDEIRLTATRIFPNNALTFFRDGADTEGRNGVQVGSTIVPSSLAPNTLGTVDVPFADLFGNARTGIFRVSAIDDGSYWPRTERTVVLTNLALQAILAPNRVLVHVRRLDDNVAVAGAAVSVLNYRNQSLGQAVTDEAGQALVALDADQAASGGPFMVIAEQDDDLTFLQLQGGDEHNLAQFDLPNRPYPTMSYEAFLYTERGICRPGETIQVTALVRDDELAVPDGMPVLLRVRDPRGALLFTGLEALSPTGFGVFTVNIPPSARTGHYDASLHTPGAEDGSDALGSTTFRVGAYTPDRLEAELTIPKTDYQAGEELQAALRVRYFLGKPLTAAEAKFQTVLAPLAFRPKEYSDYHFGNPERGWSGGTNSPVALQTDQNGAGRFREQLPVGIEPPAAVLVTVAATATEPGGRAVSAVATTAYHPYPFYIGLKREDTDATDPAGNKALRFAWVTVGSAGLARSFDPSLTYELRREEWQYMLTKDSSGAYAYRWSHERLPVAAGPVPGATEANGTFGIDCDVPGSYILTVRQADGPVESLIRFWHWRGDGNQGRPTHSAYLGITTDLPRYRGGAKATLTFTAPAPGHAIISVGDHQLRDWQSMRVKAGENTVTVAIPETPFATVYAGITLVHDSVEGVQTPRRLFGLAQLTVDQNGRRLEPQLTFPEQSMPATDLPVEIRLLQAGKPVAGDVQLLAVDEGILALTRFRTPDPFTYFFGPRRCLLRFADMYDNIFPDMDGVVAGQRSTTGGDSFETFLNPVVQEQNQPAIVLLPPQAVPASGILNTTIPLPDHTGALRIMAIAANPTGTGSTDARLLLRRPATIQLTAPRALTPGDAFEVTVQVFNHDLPKSVATVAFKTTGPVQIAGEAIRQAELAPGEEATLRVKMKANADATGATTITATLRIGTVEEQVVWNLTVRPGSPLITRGGFLAIQPGTVHAVDPVGEWFPGTAKQQVDVAATVAVETAGAVHWLRRYPYGCLEQTVSSAFPMLYLTDLAVAAGHPDTDALSEDHLAVINACERLLLMELPDGSFSSWPGSRHRWTTASIYAAHFLVEAQRAGIPLDKAFTSRTREFLRQLTIAQDGNTAAEDRAYALYVLALADEPEVGIAEGVTADPEATPFVRFLAAASLVRAGRTKAGLESLRGTLKTDFLAGTFGWDLDSPARRTGLALVALLDVLPDSPEIPRLLAALRRHKNPAGHWGTTQANALATLALGKWQRLHPDAAASTGTVTGPVGINHRVTAKHPLHYAGGTPSKVFNIHADGPEPLYCHWQVRGVPLKPNRESVAQGVTLTRTYLGEDGQPATTFKQGERVTVKLQLKTAERRSRMVVADLLPGCFEIEDASLETRWTPSDNVANMSVNSIDKRDDRLLLFCNLAGGKAPSVFIYTVRAVSRGGFTAPRVTAEAMYDPDVRAEAGALEQITVR